MRTLIVTDIHANLPALTAVLSTPEAQCCDRVLSLGDHTGFGPQPREVQQLLASRDAILLRGNHEDRLQYADTPDFSGCNWALLRWTKAQLQGLNTDFPVDHSFGEVLCTHGVPGNPYRLIGPDDLPSVLCMLPMGVNWLISGHNHTAWRVTHQGRRAVNPGSLGMAEDRRSGFAPFAVLTTEDGRVRRVEQHAVPYDLRAVRRAYQATGAAETAPEMCRIAYETMLTGAPQITLKLMRHALHIAESMALPLGDPEVWEQTDRTYPWREPISSRAYWQKTEADE